MLEKSFGLCFFLKPSAMESNSRYLYLRVSVDGIRKEISTKRKWDPKRWDSKSERAIGAKEDAHILNLFLDSMVMKINQFKMDLMYTEKTITSQRIVHFLLGRVVSKALLLEEFQNHNDEMRALVPADYALATYKRYHYTREHVKNYIAHKYSSEDIELRDLDYDFISGLDFYLKTVRNCNNNSTLKYISCLMKIIFRAVDKNIIPTDPFKAFKRKKTKTIKNPLTLKELIALENQAFSTQRLSTIRDIFVFQCYTSLTYVDVYNLRRTDIGIGVEGKYWILSARQKTGNETNIPLLPKALELTEKYKDHPVCVQRCSVPPVSSNQKMNEYLKEIATLCGLERELNTHLARHTFATTITLTNGVPIETVLKMLGHSSIRTTQVYAKVIEQKIGEDMNRLNERLSKAMDFRDDDQ
jgi:site-specific recombinase XerD